MKYFFLLSLLLALSFTELFAAGVEDVTREIKPPFGLYWGESANRLEGILEKSKAKIIEKKTVDGRLCIVATGIPQKLLLRTTFYFENNALEEVELNYGDPNWDPLKYLDFFDKTRRHLDNRYGSGKLIARTRTDNKGFISSLSGYQWVQPGSSLQLFLFTAEEGLNKIRVLSMHYSGS
ncbi:MAG: hypothetical protein ACK5NG_05715 [Chthoniobacterales bacterium]